MQPWQTEPQIEYTSSVVRKAKFSWFANSMHAQIASANHYNTVMFDSLRDYRGFIKW